MPNSSRCVQCGAALAAYAIEGYCAACLLERGLRCDEEETPARPAQRIGRYVLMEEIARGGMGVVHKAHDTELSRTIALKMILAGHFASPKEVERFRAEARAAAALRHPNIVAIHEVGENEGRQFFAMDFVSGQTLRELIREHPLPAIRAAAYLKTIAEAVHYAHEQGIVHRDLKPSNVLIDAADQPQITDFGLAKHLGSLSELTASGAAMGTPGYMPPEQASGRSRVVGPTADVYALGAILYEMVTGRPPFRAETPLETMAQAVNMEPVTPRLLNASIPRDLETICLRCLEKEPLRRYASARELADELSRFLRDEPIRARPAGRGEKLWRWCRRRPALAATLATTGLLLLIVAIGSPIAVFRISAARNGEIRERQRANQRELVARQNLYDVSTTLAQLALDAGDLRKAVMLLEREKPGAGQRDLRGWEWRYLWQSARSQELFTLGSHSNVVTALNVSPDGQVLVSAGMDRTMRVWDLRAQRQITSLVTSGAVSSVRFSPDGRLFATSGHRTLKVFEAGSRQEIFNLNTRAWIKAVSFLLGGKRLAWLDLEGNVGTWDLTEKQPGPAAKAGKIDGWLGGAIASSPDGKRLAIGEQNGTVRILNASTLADEFGLRAHTGSVSGIAFTSDGLRLVSCAWDKTVRVWDLVSRQNTLVLTNHLAWVSSVAISADDKTLVTASADQTIRLWDLAEGQELATLRGHLGEIWTLALAPDGKTIVSGGRDHAIKLWSAIPGTKNTLTVPDGTAQLAFSPDGAHVALVNGAGTLAIGDAQTMRVEGTPSECQVPIESLVFSPDGKALAVGGRSGELQLWDTKTWRLNWTATNHAPAVTLLHFSSDGGTLASLDAEGNYSLTSTDTDTIIASGNLPESAGKDQHVAFSSDNRICAFAVNSTVRLIDLKNGRTRHQIHFEHERIRSVALAPNSLFLACAVDDGMVCLWDAGNERELARLGPHRNSVRWVAFTPDGQRLFSLGGDGAIKVWDMATYLEVAVFRAGNARRAYLAADGNTLIARGDGFWRLLRAPSVEDILKSAGESSHRGPSVPLAGLVALPTRERAPPILTPAQQLPDSQHAKARAIDLARFYNARLDSSWQSLSGSWRTLSGLAAGRHILGEIEYEVRGIIQLSGLHFQETERPRFPTTIDGIPVEQDLARFHFLLGTAWPVADGTTIAAVTVHFEDGVRLEIPIIYGEDVRDWNEQSDANTLLKRGKLAWSQRIGGHGVLRLFQTFWANPRPSAKVRGLDFRSMNTESAPFLLAVSAEI